MPIFNQIFTNQKVPMTDGSELWELLSPQGECIATTTTKEVGDDLEVELNLVLDKFAGRHQQDVVTNLF